MTDDTPRVDVVLLAWRDEPYLVSAVEAVLRSTGVQVAVTVVDNGCSDGSLDAVRTFDNVTVLTPGTNTGFAQGCNLGAQHGDRTYVAFVNSDAIVAPDAIARLVRCAADPSVGLASASLRLHDRPDVINSAGNPVHFSGLSWAGGLGEPASRHESPADIASATGAAVLSRRAVFEALGGFSELFFAYCEDAELSLRAWQRGLRCVYVPEAVVLHHYEFSRNTDKFYLLERNRLLLVMTLFERRTLVVLAPSLILLEIAMLGLALRHGWARQKVRGWWWLVRHASLVRSRRGWVQEGRSRSDGDIAWILTGDVTPGEGSGFALPDWARFGSRVYWQLALRALRAPRSTRPA